MEKASCDKDGYKAILCSVCDEELSTEDIAKRAHVYVDNGVAKEATCVAEGVMNTICSNVETDTHKACTHESTRVIAIDPDAHKWETEYTVDEKASCDKEGSKSYHCEYCDDINEDSKTVITKREHNLVDTEIVKEATCTETGIMNQKCNHTGSDEYEACTHSATREIEKNADNHTGVKELVNYKAETCTEEGYSGDMQWSCCKVIAEEGHTTAALDHSFTNYVSDNNATCTEDGTKTAKCDRCEVTDTITETDSVLGHSYDLTKGTDNKNGTHTVSCTRCAEGTEGHTDVVSCTYGEGVVTEPTCTKPGYTTHTCTICSYSYTDAETAAKNHVFGEWKANDNGTHTRECTVCTDEAGRTETAVCTYGEWTQTKAPDCTEKGEKAHTCTVCKNTVTEEVDALGHEYGEADCNKPASCTRCGAETGEALGHDFTVYVETIDYTCTTD